MDLPGYEKENIKLSLKDGYLEVTAEVNKEDENEEKDKFVHKERYYGHCSRSFYVGCSNDAKANATYHNGVLTVVIPEEDTTYKDSTKYINVE